MTATNRQQWLTWPDLVLPQSTYGRCLAMIYLDTESTGLDLERDNVLEISIIDDDGLVLFDSLIRPTRHERWDAAQAINNITPAMVQDAPLLIDVLPEISSILRKNDRLIIYNAAFDVPFLRNNAAQAGYDSDPFGNDDVWCAMHAFAEKHGEWDVSRQSWRWKKLDYAAKYVGHEWDGKAHRSLSDCFALRAVWHWVQGSV